MGMLVNSRALEARRRFRALPDDERLSLADAAETAHDLGLTCPCCAEGWCPWRGFSEAWVCVEQAEASEALTDFILAAHAGEVDCPCPVCRGSFHD